MKNKKIRRYFVNYARNSFTMLTPVCNCTQYHYNVCCYSGCCHAAGHVAERRSVVIMLNVSAPKNSVKNLNMMGVGQTEDEDSVTAVISCPLIILSWHLWNFVP